MIRVVAFAVLLSTSGTAFAQTAAEWEKLTGRKYADCAVIETIVNTVTSPVGGRASAGCDTGGGGTKSCSVTIVPTQPDYFLDTTIDVNTPWVCVKLNGDNPCAFVQATPILFSSEREAKRTFTTDSDRVALSQSIQQVKKESNFTPLPPQQKTIYKDSTFAIAIKKSASSARMECTLSNGNHEIYPILDKKDLSSDIKFVSRTEGDAVFDIFKYKVR